MRVIVQRVKSSCCKVDDRVTGKIDKGFMLLVGFNTTDTKENVLKMIKKVLNLRIFDDENGVMNKSILDVKGSILSISQFTLYADTKKGNRPSYINAMKNTDAKMLYDFFNEEIAKGIHLEKGIFGADMQISLINDGPVTIILEV